MANNRQGFTLIEAIMVLVILGTISVISFGFVADTAGVFRFASEEAMVNKELWVAMERVVREMESADGSITVNSPTRITIKDSSKAACGNCADKSTTITYWLDGTTLKRGDGISGFIVAEGISAPEGQEIFSRQGDVFRVLMTKTNTEGDISLTLMTKAYPNRNITEDIQ